MKKHKIKKEEAIFIAIDYQEKLMPAIKSNVELLEATEKLIKGLKILDIPIIFTQQYTKGLGMTVVNLQKAYSENTDEFSFVEKNTFSAASEPEFMKSLVASGKRTVIIGGVEAHICVMQTVLDLLEEGYNVFVVNDCIGSRSDVDKKHSQERMRDAGAIGTTFEAVLFEICGGAKDLGFKQISALVK